MVCTVCKKEFDYPDFDCSKQPGKHVVEAKMYVHGGSANIQNIRDRRKFSPTIILKGDTYATTPNGQIISTPALIVQFSDARLKTDDPEVQWYMENVAAKRLPIRWGEEGEEIWRRNQLSPSQQVELQRAELTEITRKVKEQNELLAQTKARKVHAEV